MDYLSVNIKPRYKYCLVVDEICLESVEQPRAVFPVVKLLYRDWENEWSSEERLQGVQPPFHDGITDSIDEDVGWMYMWLSSYMKTYESFHEWDWDDMYMRPPFVDSTCDETNMVGHWRAKNELNDEKQPSKT